MSVMFQKNIELLFVCRTPHEKWAVFLNKECFLSQLELLEVRRQQEEEERKRQPPTPEPKVAEDGDSQQQWWAGLCTSLRKPLGWKGAVKGEEVVWVCNMTLVRRFGGLWGQDLFQAPKFPAKFPFFSCHCWGIPSPKVGMLLLSWAMNCSFWTTLAFFFDEHHLQILSHILGTLTFMKLFMW